jgi:hypothetical protein
MNDAYTYQDHEALVEKLIEQLAPPKATIEELCQPKESLAGIPLESASTTLFPRGKHKGQRKWYVESNTSEGLKRLQATEIDAEANCDVQSSDPDFGLIGGWIDPPVDEVEQLSHRATRERATLVDRLESATGVERRQLIIEVEAMPFEGQERHRLIALLKTYIEENRDSTDRAELIAVGSAIRKCVALLDSSEFGWLATLLESGHRVQPSLDAELEIAKMVFRRYSVCPPEQPDPHPQLSARLGEIASDYLRPRIFSRERFSTVAMLAIQSLLVMRSEHAPAIIAQVNDLSFGWFRQQLRRRMDRTVHSMESGTAAARELGALVRRIQPE